MNLPKLQAGSTLIEIAVTVLILATSLLAMATLQTRSLQFNQAAYMRSQANIYAYDIADRIRINRGKDAANIVAYNTSNYDGSPSGNSIATTDVAKWRANISRDLPGGKGKIVCTSSTHICELSIKWDDEQLFGAATSTNTEPTTELIYKTSM
ncbi:MAG: type IV pilus modification protein PilV [Gammaproteobacteria bacterium]|nr:MAG: type IV pilus modification protein PilV [Gammaproteobacteria bacterium]